MQANARRLREINRVSTELFFPQRVMVDGVCLAAAHLLDQPNLFRHPYATRFSQLIDGSRRILEHQKALIGRQSLPPIFFAPMCGPRAILIPSITHGGLLRKNVLLKNGLFGYGCWYTLVVALKGLNFRSSENIPQIFHPAKSNVRPCPIQPFST